MGSSRSKSALAAASLVAAAVVVGGCVADIGDPPASRNGPIQAPVPPFSPAAANLRRLTLPQYANAVRDLVGPEIVVPTRLEPDARTAGLLEIGASITSISKRGVSLYEDASYNVASQALANEAVRARLVTCTPTATVDDACATEVVQRFGRLAYRRPLTSDETAALVDVANQASTALGTFDDGIEFAIAAILQSPSFLFRVELGETDPDDPTTLRYGAYELANRLAFFLWDSVPDDELLHAAETGSLLTDDGLAAETDRLLADPRAHDGVRSFFSDMFRLAALDGLIKDPTVYVHFSPDVGPAAREETLRDFEQLVFERRGDYRDILTSRQTFVNRKLASIYDVPAPSLTDFAAVELPTNGARAGLLGQLAFLGPQAHVASSSATLRGKFVREVLLCGEIPPPPPNLNTGIPDPSPDTPTLRDRVTEHMQNAQCRSCHQLMDPIGLAFENFDGIARFRSTENGAVIDASGSLNGAYFRDAAQLGQLLHDDADVPRCLVRTMYRYATGHVEVTGETEELVRLTEEFAAGRYEVLALMRKIVLSRGFRRALPSTETP